MVKKPATLVMLGSLVVFVGTELWFVLDGNPDTPPLTQIVVEHVPEEIGVAVATGFAGWLVYHFIRAYQKHRNQQ